MNRRGGRQREGQIRHFCRHQYAVRRAVALIAHVFGGVRAVVEAGLAHADDPRADGNAGKLEAAFAVGQHANPGVALDAHQRPGQRRAGGGVAHDAMHGRPRGCGRFFWLGLLRRSQRCSQQKRRAQGPRRQPPMAWPSGELAARAFID